MDDLYRKERDRLFTYALSITGDPALSEDAVHDVFCRLCAKPPPAGHQRAYVYRSVRNACLDLLRRNRRSAANAPGHAWQSIYEGTEVSTEDRIISEETARALAAGLEGLRESEREAIVLHIHGDMTFREIAEVLELSNGTAASLYRRGIEKLRNLLNGEIT